MKEEPKDKVGAAIKFLAESYPEAVTTLPPMSAELLARLGGGRELKHATRKSAWAGMRVNSWLASAACALILCTVSVVYLKTDIGGSKPGVSDGITYRSDHAEEEIEMDSLPVVVIGDDAVFFETLQSDVSFDFIPKLQFQDKVELSGWLHKRPGTDAVVVDVASGSISHLRSGGLEFLPENKEEWPDFILEFLGRSK